MLNIKHIKKNKISFFESNKKRKHKLQIKNLLKLEYIRNNIKLKIDQLKNIRKKKFLLVTKYQNRSINCDFLMKELLCIKNSIKKFEIYISDIRKQINYILSNIPNILHSSVPHGKSEIDNKEVYKYGEILNDKINISSHDEVRSIKKLLDLEQASQISGSRFMILHKKLAHLHRSLINFMLDVHKKKRIQ